MFPAKGMFNIMKTRHQIWMLKYPNTGEGLAFPLTGIENARPETKAAGQLPMDISKLPFDPYEFIKLLPEWNNIEKARLGKQNARQLQSAKKRPGI
jgi:hypothetical protein